ncbi:MAG: septal ring lytic transglycosylase RlpA family protein [Microscillaceae bacterium]|nr:septal ring lytic transglycosylase RlpA family protein [Microscillaceae bacterium]MDW8461247.1 septal ring lytic transglycosylase RlpA family protein [Cytophagales bacterium]
MKKHLLLVSFFSANLVANFLISLFIVLGITACELLQNLPRNHKNQNVIAAPKPRPTVINPKPKPTTSVPKPTTSVPKPTATTTKPPTNLSTTTTPTSLKVITGKASFYGTKFHGRRTASGEIYDKEKLTAAHKTLPFQTQVEVMNLKNNKKVTVIINDRLPANSKREIDLSERAARLLEMIKDGVVDVQITILK